VIKPILSLLAMLALAAFVAPPPGKRRPPRR
jgi:hypothetical protein